MPAIAVDIHPDQSADFPATLRSLKNSVSRLVGWTLSLI